jgi:hypothetical protein
MDVKSSSTLVSVYHASLRQKFSSKNAYVATDCSARWVFNKLSLSSFDRRIAVRIESLVLLYGVPTTAFPYDKTWQGLPLLDHRTSGSSAKKRKVQELTRHPLLIACDASGDKRASVKIWRLNTPRSATIFSISLCAAFHCV